MSAGRTHGARVITNEGGFAGLFRLDYNETLFKRNYKEPVLVACTDGVGTKIKLAVEAGAYEAIGQDLVAMNLNDLVVQGAEPLLFLDYIACGKLEQGVLERIVDRRVLLAAGVALRRCGGSLRGGAAMGLQSHDTGHRHDQRDQIRCHQTPAGRIAMSDVSGLPRSGRSGAGRGGK